MFDNNKETTSAYSLLISSYSTSQTGSKSKPRKCIDKMSTLIGECLQVDL